MAATSASTLLQESNCYACIGADTATLLKLALMARTLRAKAPTADTSYQALMAYSKCYACYGISEAEMIEFALLDQISQSA